MTMAELSVEYHATAQALRERIETLKAEAAGCSDPRRKSLLRDRIRILSSMWRDARDAAVFMEHYYDKEYRQNIHYTI